MIAWMRVVPADADHAPEPLGGVDLLQRGELTPEYPLCTGHNALKCCEKVVEELSQCVTELISL